MRALVLHWGRNGGGPRFAADAVAGLRSAGVWTAFSYSRQSERAAKDSGAADADVPIDTFRSGREAVLGAPGALRAARTVARFVEKERIDCVFAAMEQIWQPAAAWAFRRMQVPYLLGVHDATFHPGDRTPVLVTTRALESRAADGILTFSSAVQSEIRDRWRFPADRIWTSTLPVRVGHGAHEDTEERASAPVRIGFFGRLQPYKGIGLLLEAARLLEAEGVRAQIEIRGDGDEPEWAGPLPRNVSVVREWTPEGRIEAVITSYDVLVAPYVEASQSGVVPLAAALGVPAVVTPAGGLVEQVVHGETGLVAERIDAPSVAAALRRLIQEPGLRHSLGENARARADSSTSIEHFGADAVTALEELLVLGKRR